jgi:hypothetical protein
MRATEHRPVVLDHSLHSQPNGYSFLSAIIGSTRIARRAGI